MIVATIRALKMHGGVKKDELKNENIDAVKKGLVIQKDILKIFKNLAYQLQ